MFTQVFSGVGIARSLVLCVCFFKIVVCPFVVFLLAMVLYVLLRCTDSDYPFGIFKLLCTKIRFFEREKEIYDHSAIQFVELQFRLHPNDDRHQHNFLLDFVHYYRHNIYV